MLTVTFGRENCEKGYILDTRAYFSVYKKPEWFDDPKHAAMRNW